jgi:hypothetical protein
MTGDVELNDSQHASTFLSYCFKITMTRLQEGITGE